MSIVGVIADAIDKNPVAAYAAALSTILMFVKFWELWRSRNRIETDYVFTSSPDEGNTVVIRNLSAIPMTIRFWQLQWRRCKWCPVDHSRTINPEDFGDIVIPSHASTTLVFCELDYFSTTPEALCGYKIYIRMNIAGRSRGITKRIYPK